MQTSCFALSTCASGVKRSQLAKAGMPVIALPKMRAWMSWRLGETLKNRYSTVHAHICSFIGVSHLQVGNMTAHMIPEGQAQPSIHC